MGQMELRRCGGLLLQHCLAGVEWAVDDEGNMEYEWRVVEDVYYRCHRRTG
jgi:hypothetical protein